MSYNELKIKRNGEIEISMDVGYEDVVDILSTEAPLELIGHFRSPVSLEEGITVREMFNALRPFKSVLNPLGEINMDEWCEVFNQSIDANLKKFTSDIMFEELIIFPWDVNLDETNADITTYWDVVGKSKNGNRYSITMSEPYQMAEAVVKIDKSIEVNLTRDSFIKNTCFPNFGDVIGGFLYEISFHGDPCDTTMFNEEMLNRIEELKESLRK